MNTASSYFCRLRCMFFILSVAAVVYGKTRGIEVADPVAPVNLSPSTAAILESRLSPVFEFRIAHRENRKNAAASTSLREQDLMMLCKTWRFLSPRFKKLYLEATQIPDSSRRFDSPGGHFAIFYKTTGHDAVVATDHYGYSISDWRVRNELPNGVPDYIDETAFALDSSRAMEIDRFGFPPPPQPPDSASASGRYIVTVEMPLGDGDYGFTYPQPNSGNTHGFSSTISLRNYWGASWTELGYDTNPVNGIRVTCAHEFFHAIQYGMAREIVRQVELDDFPWSWTEGAAVSMEELAFDSVDDYLQYASGYFDNPAMSFFNPATADYRLYTNGILALYLARHFPPRNGFEFVKTMLKNNYNSPTPFHENLRATAAGRNKSWAGMLHDFHIASFFTGDRADTARFLPDAARFRLHLPSAQPEADSIKNVIALNSAKLLRLFPGDFKRDTLSISFSGEAFSPVGETVGSGWLCTVLLRKAAVDTFISLPIDSIGNGSVAIPSWPSFSEAVIVITNGDPLKNRTASVYFSGDAGKNPVRIVVFPNPVSISRHHGTVNFRGSNISSITVRSVNGALVRHMAGNGGNADKIRWDCRTGSGLPVSPGTYPVLCTHGNGSKGSVRHDRIRLLVIP